MNFSPFTTHLSLNTKSAFTLSEVLITLGIIGVIAAMTIPQIISKYNKHIIEVGLQKTYAELSNWIIKAENDHGPFETWDFSNYNEGSIAKKYLKPYIPIEQCSHKKTTIRYCMEPDALNKTFKSWYKPTETSARGEYVSGGKHWPRYALPDGRVIGVSIEYYSDWSPAGKGMTLYVDVNGARGKTVMGQDVFTFHIASFRHPKNRLSVGTGNLQSISDQSIRSTCIKNGGQNCGVLIQRNGWKFPKNYPIKF